MQALPQSPLALLPVSFPTIPFAVIAAAAPSPALQNMPAQLRPACRLERAPLYWKIYEGGQKRGGGGREGWREEPGAVMGVIRKPDPPLGFKGNGISWQCVLISPGILHVRVPFEQKKFLAWYIMENLPSVHALLKPPPTHSTVRHAASAATTKGFTNLLFSKDCRYVLFNFFFPLRVVEGGGDSSDRPSIIKRARKSFPALRFPPS